MKIINFLRKNCRTFEERNMFENHQKEKEELGPIGNLKERKQKLQNKRI